MNTRGLLDQLLKSGQDLLQQKSAGSSAGGLSGGLGGALGGLLGGGKGGQGGGDLGTLLKGAGGGALAAGALGLLLGNKSARKLGGQALTYGGLAALGVIAYKAYGNWQAQQQQGGLAQPVHEPQTVDRLPAPQAELHSQAILKALVAAAKADGHVDAKERQLIEEQIGQLSGDPQLMRWLDAELNKPLDPAEVARAASTPEMAAEMYIASVLMVDEEHFMERAYLEELARQLKLDPALKAELEAQVRQTVAVN
ncbi:tellurite resistance TerB family protein [Aquipseudomonas guryensis]|uniref:Tellurite resistance TerB family protein n=1 Tax=Aquipseudomonas guryensis TaxID=2759165 RepID=A0A7W4DCD5_9GAMM|nr:tellurite resistance TerB family protein [Pseudomonas guryensis]MBB1520034.1 tellurite resistance TerB family protein [Pseudomonas guryensis]